MATVKASNKLAPKTSPADKAKAAKVRETLPPKNTSDSDVVDLAKSLSAFNAEVSKARLF